jgi:hypothetical protein
MGVARYFIAALCAEGMFFEEMLEGASLSGA